MSEIGALAWYITFLWVVALLFIQYWIGKVMEEKHQTEELLKEGKEAKPT
jgi:hypothetical protein